MPVGVGRQGRLARVARALEASVDALDRLDARALQERTRAQLVAAARALQLRGVARLTKAELAAAVARALHEGEAEATVRRAPAARAAARATAPARVRATARQPAPAAAARLDLGARDTRPPLRDIPWSYDEERVTAAAADPDTLFAYWEVSDPAIARARAALGAGGGSAWLNLRVYDTTGRLFDGTNANAYFDHGVERGARQWFVRVGRPGSTAVVELGLKSSEGYFARIARSGRVDFPRNARAADVEPEWMTVVSSGEASPAGRGRPRRPSVAGPPPSPPPGAPPGQLVQLPLWLVREATDVREFHLWRFFEGAWEWRTWSEASGESWSEAMGGAAWQGPITVTTWEAGPFTYPVAVEPPRREAWQGSVVATSTDGDATRVVYGPWRVVIRNLGAHGRHAVLARWEIYRSWVSDRGGVRRGARWLLAGAPRGGASERLGAGASERAWAAGSELRLAGASELWALGASEVRLAGASERLRRGASQLVLRGASEARLAGASEWRARGGSERRLAGGSERRLGGGSERRLGGGSERRLGGASERLGASEGRLARGAAAPPADSPYPAPPE